MSGVLRHDGALAYWTATVWRDERALLAYMTSGAHWAASPKLFDWGDEASAVRWSRDSADLPDWPAAVERMREEGWAVPLRDPGPGHAGGQYEDVDPVHTSWI